MENVRDMGVYSIVIPNADMELLKSIAKRLGWKVRKEKGKSMTPYEQSLDDVAHGRVTKYASVDEMFKSLGAR